MVIDFHTHVAGVRSFGSAEFPAAEFVAAMDGAGIDISVVYTTDGFFFDSRETNDALQAYVQLFPDRLVACPTVNPRFMDQALDEIRRCRLQLGMKGPLKLHPWLQAFNPVQSLLDPIARLLIELRMPVVLHDGTPPYSTPLQVAMLAARFPELTVILGHGGLRDMWPEALAAVKRYPNLWVCLTGTPPYAVERIIEEADPARIMFGTDFGFGPSPGCQQYRMGVTLRPNLPDSVRKMIMGENARRLMGL
jgi:uncharacterized protein